MAGDRPRYGLLVSALGAVVLAVSVFLPWYGVSFTAAGLAYAQQIGDQAAAQFGNAALQSYLGELHTNLSSLAGHQFTALSAHQALKDLNVVLLLLAGRGDRNRAAGTRGRRILLGLRSRRPSRSVGPAGNRRGRVRALSDGRSTRAGRRAARPLPARGRMAGVARLGGDRRGSAVAGASRGAQAIGRKASKRLVRSLRLDAGELSQADRRGKPRVGIGALGPVRAALDPLLANI